MRVLDKRLVTNQEAYLFLDAEKRDRQSSPPASFTDWQDYLTYTGLASATNIEQTRDLLDQLCTFQGLSKQDKFNLVNLPIV